jgi:hypothetical protein
MADVFAIVEKDRALKDFLAEYCSCNIENLHRMADSPPDDLTMTDIVRHENGTFLAGDTMRADFVTLERDAIVYTDEIGDLRFSVHRSAFIRSSTHDFVGTPVRLPENTDDVSGYVAGLAKLPIRLAESIVAEDLNRPTKAGFPDFESFFEASMRWTLLDILATIYAQFSEPMFDPRYQAEIDDNEEYFRRLREGQEKPDDDSEDHGKDQADDA